jgi:hypothetical protein
VLSLSPEDQTVTTDLALRLPTRPGTLLQVLEALGHAGINVEGAFGVEEGDTGVLHVLVADAELARRTLVSSNIEIVADRQVVVIPVENRPGGGAMLLRRVADAGVSVDLVYTTLDGRLTIGCADITRLQRALDEG